MGRGESLEDGLIEFCRDLEGNFPDARCCVSFLDRRKQTLTVAAAPSLPQPFIAALDGLTAGLAPGSASTAAYNDELVISKDISKATEWDGMRAEAADADILASCSTPIHGIHWGDGAGEEDEIMVLGTVDLYYSKAHAPDAAEVQAIETAAALVGLIIGAARTQERAGRGQLYDPVTELPNRRVFTQELKNTLIGMNTRDHKLGILLVDIDHFKEVNDTFGYAVGDFLLRNVAERLTGLRGKTDLLSRFGDDEFGFLINDIASTDDIREFAAKVLEAVSAPYDFGGQQLAVSASIGGSLYPWDGEDAQTLLRNTENALRTAKKQGRGHYRLYAPTMGGYAFEKLQLKMALGHAIENRELEVYYQPKVDSQTFNINGSEALTYWNHPAMGSVSPAKFIPLAEETGLIIPLGEWVLRTACEQVQRWRNAGFEDLTMAINISAIQFRERSFPDTVGRILKEADVDPSAIELELTESVAMNEVEKTMERMAELSQLGVRIAIDDFGTGYSSLTYLKRFPIHTLKIDRSFVMNTPQDKEDRGIVLAVIALAHHLGLEVVAEGVETGEQADYLRDEGCEYLQGYHFSKPIPAHAFETLVRSGIVGAAAS